MYIANLFLFQLDILKAFPTTLWSLKFHEALSSLSGKLQFYKSKLLIEN